MKALTIWLRWISSVGKAWVLTLIDMLVVLVLAGCEHKMLYVPVGGMQTVAVDVLWDKAPYADPAGMAVRFFPATGAERLWRFEIPGRDGGLVEVPAGTYDIFTFNNDLRNLTISEASEPEGLTATTLLSGNGPYMRPSGMLYRGILPEAVVPQRVVEYGDITETQDDEEVRFRVWPDSMCTVYHVLLPDVRNMRGLRAASARLSGLPGKMNLSTGKVSGEPMTVEFPLEISDTDPRQVTATLSAATTALGEKPENPQCMLTLLLVAQSGKVYSKNFDVSAQILNNPWPRNVFIIVRDVEMPSDEEPGHEPDVGLDVEVDGWTTVDVTYETDLRLNY